MTIIHDDDAISFARSSWGWLNPDKNVIDAAKLQLDIERGGLRCGEIVTKLELMDSKRVNAILDSSNDVSMPVIDRLLHNGNEQERNLLGKSKNRVLALHRSIQYFEAFNAEGLAIHPAMTEKEVLENCRSLNAVLILIEHLTPVLVFSELGDSYFELNGIADVDKKKHAIFSHLDNDKALLLGVAANAAMITSAQNSVSKRVLDNDSANRVIVHEKLMKDEARRALAIWHDVAIKQNATDIHITPDSITNSVILEIRVWGKMKTLSELSPMLAEYHQIKNFLQHESRATSNNETLTKPADGEYSYVLGGKKVNVRASFMPLGTDNSYADNFVSIRLRLLPSEKGAIKLSDIGTSELASMHMRQSMLGRNGLVLMVGATGTGKSTTMLGMVECHRELYGDTKSRASLEDPVEREVPGITQFMFKRVQGKKESELLELYLRSLVRHDPDFMMIGEIRDGASATFAANAAVTGHKTLATIHGSNTIEAIERILNMIENPDQKHMVINSISHLFGQRLVPILCEHCKTTCEPTEQDQATIDYVNQKNGSAIKLPKLIASEGEGCEHCNFIGFTARKPVNEVLELTPEIRKLVLSDNPNKYELLKSKRVLTLEQELMPYIESLNAPISVLFEE